jgi:hypothetical protein
MKDYNTIPMALKKKSDGAMPSYLIEFLSECYGKWKDQIT